MASIKLNISMEDRAAETLRRRAAETGKPMGRFLADLVEAEARQAQDALAEEGYRVLSEDTSAFAKLAWPLAKELPWVWDESDPDARGTASPEAEESDGHAEASSR